MVARSVLSPRVQESRLHESRTLDRRSLPGGTRRGFDWDDDDDDDDDDDAHTAAISDRERRRERTRERRATMTTDATTTTTRRNDGEESPARDDARDARPTATQARRASAFAPNVKRSASRTRLGREEGERGAGEGEGDARDARGTAKRASEDGEGGTRTGSRLGKSAGENGGEARKKSRLSGVAAGGGKAPSRLRTARESGTPAGKKPASANATTPHAASPARVAPPLGFRSPAPSRASKQMVPAVARMEAKPSPSPTPTPTGPLALPPGALAEPISSPGALPLVAVPPPMVIPAHRWVRSAGSTRGGRVGEGSRRDALEASTSYADDPAMTIRDIIRQKSAEERANEAKSRILKKAKSSSKPMPDFGKKKTASEPVGPLELPGRASMAPKLAVMAPQVQVIDGNIVINPQSLTVNAAAEKDVGMSDFKRVEESGTRLNSATYSNRAKAEKWSKDDTELFYRAMTQFGTDFSLIARLFPGRTRRQVKRKYLIEDRADPRRVEAAIKHRDQDPAMYKRLIEVLQAQAAEADLARSSIDARVVLDADTAEEATPPAVEDAQATDESSPKTGGQRGATKEAAALSAEQPTATRARRSRK